MSSRFLCCRSRNLEKKKRKKGKTVRKGKHSRHRKTELYTSREKNDKRAGRLRNHVKRRFTKYIANDSKYIKNTRNKNRDIKHRRLNPVESLLSPKAVTDN